MDQITEGLANLHLPNLQNLTPTRSVSSESDDDPSNIFDDNDTDNEVRTPKRISDI